MLRFPKQKGFKLIPKQKCGGLLFFKTESMWLQPVMTRCSWLLSILVMET